MPLCAKSDAVRHVDVTPVEKRRLVMKPFSVLKTLDQNSTEMYLNDPVIDYYPNRPAVLEDTSLYKFRWWYDYEKSTEKSKTGRLPSGVLELRNSLGLIKTRSKPYLINRKMYNVRKESELYFHALLIPHCPFRSTADLLVDVLRIRKHLESMQHD